MKISRYTKLGLLIVASLTVLIWGLSYLKGNDFFSRNDSYYVIYKSVDGLLEANKVTVNGYQVGQVRNIEFAPGKSGNLLVTLMIDNSFKIPINTVAKIISSDIMGTRSIQLIISKENAYYLPNDTLPGDVEADLKEQVSMQVLPIKNKAEQLLSTLDSAITVLTVILNEDARENLSESFANINKTIENIEKTSADLHEIVSSEKGGIQHIVQNFDDITTLFKNNSEELENTIKNLSSFSDSLSEISISPIVLNVSKASEEILSMLEKLNSDKSTAGLLLNDPKLYESISALSNNLSYLATDIQANPKRYLQFSALDFGKEYYINASGDLSAKNILFKVHLISTETQIPLNSDIFKGLGDVEEYYASGVYSYLIGATSSYSEIMEIQKKAREEFSEANVVAFKNGRLIKLENALKSLR